MGFSLLMEFTVSGLSVRIGFSFFWSLAFLLCYDFADEIKLALVFSLLHEAGHFFAILLCGQRPKRLCFGLFGMTIVREGDMNQNYKQELITALAGPFVNTAFAVLFFSLYLPFGKSLLFKAFAVNLMLASFNLMPVFSLDGGRALECLLRMRLNEEKSEAVLKAVSFAFIIMLDTLGLYILIKSGYNFTLLAVGVYLTAMIFVKS